MSTRQAGQPSSFWITNRGVVAICYLVLVVIFFATDAIGGPARAYVSGDLGSTPFISTWFSLTFLIAAVLIMPLVGSLQKKFGTKKLTTIGCGVFGIACIASSIAQEPSIFIAMRALQGLGGGIIPGCAGGYLGGQLGEKYNPIGKGLSALGLVIGGTGGISISAFFTWNMSWRILYLSLGIALLATVAAIQKLMPESTYEPKTEINWPDYLLMAGGFGTAMALAEVGNQREWLNSNTFITLGVTSAALLGLFGWKLSEGSSLFDLRIFKDVNFCISTFNLSVLMFLLFSVFAIIPRFLTVVTDNTISNYGAASLSLWLTSTFAAFLVSPGVNPFVIAKNIKTKKILASICIAGLGITTLWMSYTSAQESDINVMMKLGAFGFFYGILQCLEIQMSFVTMPPLLMTSAASILFFCSNLQKALAGSINAAILTVTSQGSWDTFRGAITEDNAALMPFKNSILGHPNGTVGSNWSAGSLELINRAIAKQAEVLSFIDVSHWIGVVLLFSCFLPLLHREAKENKDSGKA